MTKWDKEKREAETRNDEMKTTKWNEMRHIDMFREEE